MHAMWKGSISFGLVNIPVKMYSASHDHELKFVMLHKDDLSEIRYARICKEEGKEVPWKDIVKGFEIAKGEYVVLDQKDFESVAVQKTNAVEILDFTKEEEIEPSLFTKPYYLEPDKGSAKAYALLREALKKSKKVGIARYVLHNREHVAVIKAVDKAILMIELRYASEIVPQSKFDFPEAEKAQPKEMEMALKLIDQLTKKFKASDYKDTYVDELRKVIDKKSKGKKIATKKTKEAKPSKITDIMSLLKESLKEKKPHKKRASA